MLDTWALLNATAVPVRIVAILVRAPELNGANVPLTCNGVHGVFAWFADHDLDVLREERGSQTWAKVIIPPDETVIVQVDLNRDVDVRYRRAGWSGMFERRRISIAGYI